MKMNYKDCTPKISLPVLGTLCFVTLLMCQIRFKITKELSHEITPPIMRSRDCWFLYTIGNSNSVQCDTSGGDEVSLSGGWGYVSPPFVRGFRSRHFFSRTRDPYSNVLRAFVVISSPVVSLVSTVFLLYGKIESNPYYFIPWLFLTLKGLLLVQTDNLISIFKDMTTNSNHAFGCRMEDMKWLLFYFTFFLIDLVEAFSFCEIFDLFLLLWKRHPGYNEESANTEAVRKEIADIMENLSKCSSIKSSKLSTASITDNEEGREILIPKKSLQKSSKSEEKTFDERQLGRFSRSNEPGENLKQKQLDLRIKMNTHSDGDAHIKGKRNQRKLRNFSSTNISVMPNPNADVMGNIAESAVLPTLCDDIISNGSVNKQELCAATECA